MASPVNALVAALLATCGAFVITLLLPHRLNILRAPSEALAEAQALCRVVRRLENADKNKELSKGEDPLSSNGTAALLFYLQVKAQIFFMYKQMKQANKRNNQVSNSNKTVWFECLLLQQNCALQQQYNNNSNYKDKKLL